MKAAAGLYHSYFTGLILTLVTRRGAADAAEWVFRLFRHQHHEKFLSSFDKLGLTGMPDAVACAAFHYLSNSVGGVDGRVHARERPQGLGQFRAAALDLSRRQHLRRAERGLARLPARLVRAERCLPRQPAARLRLHGPDDGRPAWAVRLLPRARPRTGCRRSGCSSVRANCRRRSTPQCAPAAGGRIGRPSGWPRPSATMRWSTSAPVCRGWPKSSGRPRPRTSGASPAG